MVANGRFNKLEVGGKALKKGWAAAPPGAAAQIAGPATEAGTRPAKSR